RNLRANLNRLSCRPPAEAGSQPTTLSSIAGVAGQLLPGFTYRHANFPAHLAESFVPANEPGLPLFSGPRHLTPAPKFREFSIWNWPPPPVNYTTPVRASPIQAERVPKS